MQDKPALRTIKVPCPTFEFHPGPVFYLGLDTESLGIQADLVVTGIYTGHWDSATSFHFLNLGELEMEKTTVPHSPHFICSGPCVDTEGLLQMKTNRKYGVGTKRTGIQDLSVVIFPEARIVEWTRLLPLSGSNCQMGKMPPSVHPDDVDNSDVPRRPSVQHYINPAKLSASLSILLDRNAPLARLDTKKLLEALKRVQSEKVGAFDDEEDDFTYEATPDGTAPTPVRPGLTRRLSSIRLVNPESGRIKEISVRNRKSSASAIRQEENPSNFDSLEDVGIDDIFRVLKSQVCEPTASLDAAGNVDAVIPKKANVCEAVLRSVFAPKEVGESREEGDGSIEILKEAFDLPESQFDSAERRAKYAARYRRAELKAKFEALNRDKDEMVRPDQFGDLKSYQTWKQQEQGQILDLITALGGEMSPFSGSVQVKKIAAYHLKPPKWIKKLRCSSGQPSFQVYYTVKVLPATSQSPSSGKILDFDGDDATSLLEPAFLSKVIMCKGTADWPGESSWITVNSLQDRILIEFWERKEQTCISLNVAKRRIAHGCTADLSCGLGRKRRRKPKVAPRTGDSFLGQKLINFSYIEGQALIDGRTQGTAPEELENLADERNRDCKSVVQIQFACCCKSDSRDKPPNESLLKPPVDDLGQAYDCLLRVAFHADKAEYKVGEKWEKVLEGFASHYRIRPERSRLSLIGMWADKFEPTYVYLNNVVEEWSPVCTAAREGRLTKSELSLHSGIAGKLAKPAEEALENYQTVFAGNQTSGALSKLLELLGLILCWEPSPNKIVVPLQGWIEDSCEKGLRRKLYCDSNGETQEEVTLENLKETVKLIRSDLREHREVYQSEFPPEIDLICITAPFYYKLVIQYTKSFIDSVIEKTFTAEYGELASELLFLQQDIEEHGIQLAFTDIHHLFEKNITEWLVVMEPRMFDFVMNSCSGENWEPLTKTASASEVNFLYSGSVIDLYWMMTEYVDELTSRLLTLPSGLQYVWHIEAGVCSAVQLYVERLEKLCLRDLPHEEREHPSDEPDQSDSDNEKNFINAPHTPRQCISMTLCVKLNNIYEVIQRQQELESYLDLRLQSFIPGLEESYELQISEDVPAEERFKSINDDLAAKCKVGDKFKDLSKIIHHIYNNVTGSIIERMQDRLRSELHYVLTSVPEGEEYDIVDELELLTSYMDENIIVMNDWLQPVIFKRLLKEIAKALFFCMEEFVLNKGDDPTPITPHQREIIGRSVTELYDYFDGYGEGNGRGLTSAQTHQACARLRKILECWDLSTDKLCCQYWPAWVKFNDDMSREQTSLSDLGDISEDDDDLSSTSSSFMDEPSENDVELHVLDYLLLLKQRRDDEAKELVATQSLIATEKMTQFMFGLPGDEEIIASFNCRDAATKKEGTLHITTKHVAFAEKSVIAGHNRRHFVLSFVRLMSVHSKSDNSVVFVPFNLRPKTFIDLTDPAVVALTLFQQIQGTGIYLEKNMSPAFSSENSLSKIALKEYHCSKKQGIIRQLRGTLKISPTHVTFEPMEILRKERESIDFASICNVAERKGYRANCLVIDLKFGGHVEFIVKARLRCIMNLYNSSCKVIPTGLGRVAPSPNRTSQVVLRTHTIYDAFPILHQHQDHFHYCTSHAMH
ncbi:hypothetical protein R1flu_003505 [Riccia fluitans]|uniref:MHD2 domain-containing protein n=1 Tax=Riccia fluitans TaxID=41844 RepID=A0ABD1Y9S6_9MARC